MPRDYDKPKRSWREIDRKKDSSSHRPGEKPKNNFNQARSDAASKTYKSKLDSFFDGEGKAPDHIAEQLSKMAPTSEEGKARAKATKTIKDAGTSSAADKAVAAYLKKWELPPDYDVLAQVLTCADEDYVSDALRILTQMLDSKRIPQRIQILEQRLRRVKTLAEDPDLQDEVDKVLKKLRLFS